MRQGLWNGTVSVRLSVCPSMCHSTKRHRSKLCCRWRDVREISIDGGGHSAANASSVTLTAEVRGWTQTCVKSTCIILSWASAHRGKWGQLTPWKNGWKIRKRKHAKKSSFLCLRYILRAIRAGRCRERRYADHIFIQIYFRMHHFVVKFSKFSSP